MSLRERLDIFEEQLQGHPLSHKSLFLVVLLTFLGYFAYMFVFEPLLQELEAKEQQLQSLQAKIKKNRKLFYLKQIKKLKQDTLALRTQIEEAKEQKASVLERLRQNNALFINNENLAKLLDKILLESKRNALVLDQVLIGEKETPYLGKIYEKKELNIKGQGEFLNVVKFLRSIESSEVLLKVDNLLIETNGSVPSFSFSLKLYGGSV